MRAIRGRIIKAINDLGQGVDEVMRRTSAMVTALPTDIAAVVEKGVLAAS